MEMDIYLLTDIPLSLFESKQIFCPFDMNWDLKGLAVVVYITANVLNHEMILLTCHLSQIYFPITAARQTKS